MVEAMNKLNLSLLVKTVMVAAHLIVVNYARFDQGLRIARQSERRYFRQAAKLFFYF